MPFAPAPYQVSCPPPDTSMSALQPNSWVALLFSFLLIVFSEYTHSLPSYSFDKIVKEITLETTDTNKFWIEKANRWPRACLACIAAAALLQLNANMSLSRDYISFVAAFGSFEWSDTLPWCLHCGIPINSLGRMLGHLSFSYLF